MKKITLLIMLAGALSLSSFAPLLHAEEVNQESESRMQEEPSQESEQWDLNPVLDSEEGNTQLGSEEDMYQNDEEYKLQE